VDLHSLLCLLLDLDQTGVDVLAAGGLFAVDGDAVGAGLEGVEHLGVELDLDIAGAS